MKHKITCLVCMLLWTLMACRSSSIFQDSGAERVFRERYLQKPFYTATLLHPYRYNEDYLVDLTGTVAELDTETLRAPVVVPLGSPITVVGLDDTYVLARLPGPMPLVRLRVQTQRGTLDELRTSPATAYVERMLAASSE